MDDLSKLRGVGEATVKLLAAVSITSFAALAAETPETLADKLKGAVRGSPDFADWIAQAKALGPAPDGDAVGVLPQGSLSEAVLIEQLDRMAGERGVTRTQLLVAIGLVPEAVTTVSLGTAESEGPHGGGESDPALPTATGELTHVRVTGPKKGRYRAGRRWSPEPWEGRVRRDVLAALEADRKLQVERLG